MKFQFYSCATVDFWKDPGGVLNEHSEVHFVLFGRELQTNESVAVTFRYCPYLVVADIANASDIHYSHHDTIERTPLLGYSETTMQVYRLFVPMKRNWQQAITNYKYNEDATELLDYHHTLELQMRMVLNLKPMDLVSLDNAQLTSCQHTTVSKEYHVSTRLTAATRGDFPLTVKAHDIYITQPTILSFDIEAYSNNGAFPTPSNSHTIGICYSHQSIQGETLKEDKLVMKDSEKDLLLAFSKAVLDCDPDLITGWNTHGFD
jgi:DNA polymerase elongation subunit (family B)